jgi:TPP-dependent pyruvate/acetoin dehydrogenase alpha subunit
VTKKKTIEDLIAFEEKVAEIFNSGLIRAPIHLSRGNEAELINIFENIQETDWIFCSWRSHLHCLLKGVEEEKLLEAILQGRSISLCFPEHRVFSSAIVGGQVSIATGVAFAEKLKGSPSRVWCFMGDMTSETGIAQTSIHYSAQHELPINFVVEDNGVSVMTDTRKVWGSDKLRFQEKEMKNLVSYRYENAFPHAGAGKRIQF